MKTLIDTERSPTPDITITPPVAVSIKTSEDGDDDEENTAYSFGSCSYVSSSTIDAVPDAPPPSMYSDNESENENDSSDHLDPSEHRDKSLHCWSCHVRSPPIGPVNHPLTPCTCLTCKTTRSHDKVKLVTPGRHRRCAECEKHKCAGCSSHCYLCGELSCFDCTVYCRLCDNLFCSLHTATVCPQCESHVCDSCSAAHCLACI